MSLLRALRHTFWTCLNLILPLSERRAMLSVGTAILRALIALIESNLVMCRIWKGKNLRFHSERSNHVIPHPHQTLRYARGRRRK